MQAPFQHRPMGATHGQGGRAGGTSPAAGQRAAMPGRPSAAANIAAPRETIADYAASHALGVARTAAGPNRTGLPDRLKSSMESLSGIALDDVRVHRNSARPAQLQALAHTQGNEIHLGPGQERHLAHEAWHVVQQKQGRVRPTMSLGGTAINDDAGLETEADRMGDRALRTTGNQASSAPVSVAPGSGILQQRSSAAPVVQRRIGFEFETGWLLKAPANTIGMHTPVINGDGWHVVPDRTDYTIEELEEMGIGQGKAHVGYGSMEFVTDAFEEDQVGPGGALDRAMEQIEVVGHALERAPRGLFGGRLDAPLGVAITGGVQWGQSLAIPRPADGEGLENPAYMARVGAATTRRDNIVVRRIGALRAAPQMTGGIKYDRLHHLLDRMSQPSHAPADGQVLRSAALMAESDPGEVAVVHNKAVNARTIAGWAYDEGNIPANRRDRYAGVLTLLASYVRLAALYATPPYDKAITPLLSRTDFGQLPASIRNVPTFVDDVLLASGRYGGGGRADMAAAGNDKLFVEAGRHDAITTRGWLQAIVAGRDPIDWEQDRDPKWDAQPVGHPADLGLGHVYEFRRLEKGIPLNEWRAYALGMADLVARANRGALD